MKHRLLQKELTTAGLHGPRLLTKKAGNTTSLSPLKAFAERREEGQKALCPLGKFMYFGKAEAANDEKLGKAVSQHEVQQIL